MGTIYFFWYYRRKPDLVETAVKESGMAIGKHRERNRRKIHMSGDDEWK
jgi:hypothetical protein